MKVVIFSHEQDYHTQAVSWALSKLGVESLILPFIAQDSKSAISYDVLNSKLEIGGVAIEKEDAVWLRRPQVPIASNNVHPADIKFVENELKDLYKSMLYYLGDHCFCVNKYFSEIRMDRKTEQLKLAISVGFNVPITLITNRSIDANEFVKDLPGKCIYKALLPHVWDNSEEHITALAKATCIDISALADEQVVSSCPLLLQQYIEKIYDVRVVVMGSYKKAVYFKSLTDQQYVDWRPEYQKSQVELVELKLPKEIELNIDKFMEESQMVFGSFDFSVDKSGMWYFLEINTQGQFLWLDTELELGLLEDFSRFLVSKDKNYKGAPCRDKRFSHLCFSRTEQYQFLLKKSSQPQEEWFYTTE